MSYLQQLEQLGFFSDGLPVAGILDGDVLREARETQRNAQHVDRSFKYSSVLDEEKLGVNHVYELDGSPCIYFKSIGWEPGPDEIAGWHKTAWNHGLARMLWVCTPTCLRVFNAFAAPPDDPKALQSADVLLFESVSEQLGTIKAQQLHRERIESGQFWFGEIGRRISRDTRVDQQLVGDLHLAAQKLVEEGLNPIQAHRLLLRTIFVAYLEVKRILPEQLFEGLEVDTFEDILSDTTKTKTFFERMTEAFNGDLFPPLPKGAKLVEALTDEQLKIPQCILARTDLTTLQQSFKFWRFDFGVIPIELISSIYERFIHTADPKRALRAGTHFTPVNLVDLVLSQVFDDGLFDKPLPTDAKVLDLACGSGVFLVEALRRLVARRLAAGERHTRALVRDTLYKQVFGIDIAESAVEIAAFSLSLTAFELDPVPDSRHQLRFKKELRGRNLFVGDAFDLEASFNRHSVFGENRFDVVVGNPPWTRPSGPRSASPSGKQFYMGYCKQRDITLPFRNPPEQAFVWRSRDFAHRDARLGMILEAKRFFSHHEQSVQAKCELIESFEPKLLINLAALHDQKLFPATKQPALVLIATNRDTRGGASFPFVAIEFSRPFRDHGILQIGSEKVRRMSAKLVAANPDALKIASWGTARDMALVTRLKTENETLVRLLAKRSLEMQQGFIVGNRRRTVPSELQGFPCLTGGRLSPFEVMASDLPRFEAKQLERPREARIYRGPLVLVGSGLRGNRIVAAYSSRDLVYSRSQYGISFATGHRQFAHYVNALLNSSLITYLTFLTATNWGIEKYEILLNDIRRLPIPDPDCASIESVEVIRDLERELREEVRRGKCDEGFIGELDKAVFKLYGLDKFEQTLVEDMVNVTIDHQRKHEKSTVLDPASLKHCSEYSEHLIGIIQPFLETRQQRRLVADVLDVNGPLRAVRFSIVPTSDIRRPLVKAVRAEGLSQVLHEVTQNLDEQIAKGVHTRQHLRVYRDNSFYVVKPSQHRFWTRSAGLNDGDSVLKDLLARNQDGE